MGNWKRSGADALREYEQNTNYAYNQAAAAQKARSRTGLNALAEYEQGGGLERAYENYRAAVLERQQAAISKERYETQQSYQQQVQDRKKELEKIMATHGASQTAKSTAYQNYVNAVKQQELLEKQRRGEEQGVSLTENEKHFLQTQQYKSPATAAQKAANATNQAIAQKTVEKAKTGALTKQEFFKDAQVAGESGTYKEYMQNRSESASVEAMQEQSDELQSQIETLEQEIWDRQIEMGDVTSEESQARQEETKRQIAEGTLESTQSMETRLSELQQEKALLDNRRALKQGEVMLGALDEGTLALLDEYVHGTAGYVREHANGYNQPGQSKKSARQDLLAKGYTEDEIKKLAEYYERQEDYKAAQEQSAEMEAFGREHPVAASVASALMSPFKAAGNVESVRGVLPSWLGGYQNEDMPTNIYSGWYGASRASAGIRSGAMENMGETGQFLYQAGMSALDSAVNMGVSVGLVGAAGLTGSAAQSAVANTMNWVMGSQVAADSVYEGIQSGKSNRDALIDGIVEGAIEGITEKYSVGDLIENLLSGKAVWKKVLRAFASEGTEEVASNWLNRIYDVVFKHGRSEVMQAWNAYLADGLDEKTALKEMIADFAKEDGLSFLAGGLSGLAMSGTYRAFGDLSTEANVQSAAAWAIENGQVQDVIDLGLAQGQGKAYEQAARMQAKVDAGQMPTQGETAAVLREYAKAQQEAAETTEATAATESAQTENGAGEDPTYQIYKNAVRENERATAAFETNAQRSAIYAAEEAGQITREQAEAALDALEEETQSRGQEAERIAQEAQQLRDAANARARVRGQSEQAEREMDKAMAEQDKATIQAVAEANGLPRQVTNTAVMGYTAYQGEISAEEYAEAVALSYQAGASGQSLEAAQRAAADVQSRVIQAVWNLGKQSGQRATAENGTKYSINRTQNLSTDEQFREYRAGKFMQKDEFAFGLASELLQKAGISGEIVMSQSDYKKAKTAKHNVPQRVFRNLNNVMQSAVLSFEKGNEVGVLTSEIDGDGKPLLLAFRKNVDLDGQTVTRMTSAYGLDNPAAWVGNQVNNGKTLRILNTEKADNFLNGIGYKAERTGNYRLGDTVTEIHKSVKEGKGNGTNVSDAGQKRDAGAGAEKQTQRMERAAEGRNESAGRGKQRAAAARDLSKDWAEISVSEFGLSGDGTVRVMPQNAIAQNADAKRAAEFFRTAGVKDYQFVVGELAVETESGTYYADAVVTENGTVVVRLDSEQYSATQLAKHEGYHIAASRNAELAARIRKRLVAEGKITKAQIDSYIEAYHAIYGENVDAYVEEIVADAYAGINRTEYGTNSIRTDVTMEVGKWTKKTGSSRGPPSERYSIEKTTENRAFVEVTEDILSGVPKSEWVSVVKENLKEKFPDGITLGRNEIRIDGQSRREMTYSRYMQWLSGHDQQTMSDKLRATNNSDEILQATTNWVNEGLNHSRTDRITDFARGTVLLRVGENDYTADVVVGTRKNGRMVLYDVLNLQTASFTKSEANAAISTNPSPGAARNTASVSEASIRKSGENVKQKFSISLEQNSHQTEQTASEAEQTAQDEKKGKKTAPVMTMDTIPKRAQTYLQGAEKNLIYGLERSLRMPIGWNAKALRSTLDGMVNSYLRVGGLSDRLINETFETVYEKNVETVRRLQGKCAEAMQTLKQTTITLTKAEREALGGAEAFAKQGKGKWRVAETGGVPLKEVYQELRKTVPELFPAGANQTVERRTLFFRMGVQRMEQTARQVESLDGENAALWKEQARGDFHVGVKAMFAELHIAKRYAEAKMRSEKEYNAPESAEEAEELYHTARNQQRDYEREVRKWLLTAEDQKTVGMLLRGDITPKMVKGRENAEGILAVYEAKADYDLTMLRLAEWKKKLAAQRMQRARDALGNIQDYKDKRLGIQYKRETQKRNVYDIAPEANAEAINKAYFEPVRKASADAVRLKNRLRERVADMKLSRKTNKGDRVNEAAAVQIVGEAQNNMRMIQNSRGRIETRDGKNYDEWKSFLDAFWKENPGLDEMRIQNAVQEFHNIYDELYHMMNNVRVRNGYDPINYRAGYFPHFQLGQTDGILGLMGKTVGVDAGVTVLPNDLKGILRLVWQTRKKGRGSDALPTEINGRTGGFKPGIQWFGHAQQRSGYQTVYDAVEGFDQYIEGAANVICYTDAIRNLRALASQVRYLSGNEGLREQEDAIRTQEDMSEEAKEEAIAKIKENGKYTLSGWAANLDEYTNLLAGKKSELDRSAESMLNRSVHAFLKKWQGRVAANMVALNPGSWLTNFGVMTQAGAQMKTVSMLKAAYQQTINAWEHDGFAEKSDFLTARAGSDALVNSWTQNASAALSKPMEWIDWYSANVIVRARYAENIERGMSEESAIREADSFAADVMADRSKGAMPTLFESRNPLYKMFTQFQLEVNNTFSYLFKDLPREQRKKGVGALALALFKFALGGWLYNELYEALVGRRPMLDPLDLMETGVSSLAGYERNNLLYAALNGAAVFEKKEDKENWVSVVGGLAAEVGQELPFIGNLTGGGKLPYASSFPDISSMWSTLESETLTGEEKMARLWKELKSPLAYWVLPFGGGQIKKTGEAIAANLKKGSYATDGTLQYPIYEDTTADKVKNWTANLIFGKSSTKAAQDWVESGFKNLNEKETAAYESLIEFENQRETYDFIRAMKNVKLTADKKMLLGSYEGVSEEARAEYYYQVMATDKQRADMEGMREEERIEYVREKIQDAESDKLKESIRTDFEAGTVSEEKTIQKLVANDFAGDEDEAYWKVDEWRRGEEAKLYDEVLAVVDAGGDVAKAAQRYLEHGKKASDIASSITSAYKERYIAADAVERKRLKALLLDAYAALGYDRKDKSRDIDAWLKQD